MGWLLSLKELTRLHGRKKSSKVFIFKELTQKEGGKDKDEEG